MEKSDQIVGEHVAYTAKAELARLSQKYLSRFFHEVGFAMLPNRATFGKFLAGSVPRRPASVGLDETGLLAKFPPPPPSLALLAD